MSSRPAPPTSAAADASRFELLPLHVNRSWAMAALVVGLAVGTFLLYWPSAVSLWEEWGDTKNLTYTHGYLIAALCIWLLIRNRRELSSAPVEPNLLAGGALFVASIVWLVAVRAGVQGIHQLLLPVLIWLGLCAVCGFAIARFAAFPIAYLIFAIPAWDHVNFALQAATVEAVDLMLRITGITAYVDGNIVHVTAGVFEIAGGCSGLHFFIVGLAIAALYGDVGRDSLATRTKILTIGLLLSLVSNWLRVYLIILAGDLTDMQHYLVRVEHYRFGWVMFAAMMIVFFSIVRRFPASEPPKPVDSPATEVGAATRVRGIAVAAVALSAVPLWNLVGPVRAAVLPPSSALLPEAVADWTGPEAQSSPWTPSFLGADMVERADYRADDGRIVQMYVAAYASQAQGKELVGYSNSLLGAGEGRIVSQQRIDAPGPSIEAIAQAHEQSVIRYFYEIGAQRTNSDGRAQLWYGLASLREAPLSKVIAMRAACRPDCDSARELVTRFEAAHLQRSATE